jgi:hypothetical protein
LAKKLRNSMRMTSGALVASIGQYSLTVDVLQEVQAKVMAAAAKEMELLTNHVPWQHYWRRRCRMQAGGSLTADNLKVLIQSRKRKGDSPMKSLREEL